MTSHCDYSAKVSHRAHGRCIIICVRRVCYWSWVSHSATKHVSRLCKQYVVKAEKLEATDVFPRDAGGMFGDSYVKRARETEPGMKHLGFCPSRTLPEEEPAWGQER